MGEQEGVQIRGQRVALGSGRTEAVAGVPLDTQHDGLARTRGRPQSRGHLLVIPKAPSRNLLDADPAVLSAVIPKVQKLAQAVMKATGADGFRLVQFNEAPAGQTVFHLHFHIMPVYEGTELGRHASGQKADDADLAALAKSIAAAL